MAVVKGFSAPRSREWIRKLTIGSKYHYLPCTSISRTIDLQNVLLSAIVKMAPSTDVNFGTEENVGWRPDCPFPDRWIDLGISLSESSEFFEPIKILISK